jgi:hypothetical protein
LTWLSAHFFAIFYKSQLLKEIMVDPEMAEFTLPLDRKIPVSVTVQQQTPQSKLPP